MVDDYKVYSFNFIDENRKEALYWRDVGTLEAYYEANMDLVSVAPVFNLYDEAWPIRTHMRQYPPAKFVFNDPGRTGEAHDSIVSMGCIISGGSVRSSVLSPDVRVNSYSRDRQQHPVLARERSAGIAASARPSLTATFTFPKARSSATTPKPTARSTTSPTAESLWSRAIIRCSRIPSRWTTSLRNNSRLRSGRLGEGVRRESRKGSPAPTVSLRIR